MDSNLNSEETQRTYSSAFAAIEKVMKQSGLDYDAAKTIVDNAIDSGAIRISSSSVDTGGTDGRTYSSVDSAIERVMNNNSVTYTDAKTIVDNAIDSGAIRISSNSTGSVSTAANTSSFRQGDVIQIDGNNYYVEGGDVAGGARLRLITDSSVISNAHNLTDGNDRHQYFINNSTAGRITEDGFQEATIRTVSNVAGMEWKTVVAPNPQEYGADNNVSVISVSDITDTSPGTQYKVTADIGNGDEIFTLKYGENGDYTLISKNGVEYPKNSVFIDDIKVHATDTHSYYSKHNGYTTLTNASTVGQNQARVNGMDSQDRPDIHDNVMHHTHVTQTMGYTVLEKVAMDENAAPVVTVETRSELILGLVNTSANPNVAGSSSSPTGQWTIQDATKYVDDLAASGRVSFSPSTKTTYFNDKYKTWLADLEGSNSSINANNLRQDVEKLKLEFEAVKNQMEEWYGSSADSAQDAIACILGKFIVTMGNIENALIPACEAVEQLILSLKEMKLQDETLQNMLTDYENHIAAEPPKTITKTRTVIRGRLLNGRPRYVDETYQEPNPEHATWVTNKEAKEQAIAEQRLLLEDLTLKVEEYFLTITNYQKAVKQFSSFVSPTGTNYSKISTKENLIANHDDILYEFENFARMPVITNLTDYSVGDIVMFDDSYGTLYKVVAAFDEDGKPLGYLQIIAVDENGNPITGAEVITIWDQREIVPVNGTPSEEDPGDDGRNPGGSGRDPIGGGGGDNNPSDDPEEPTPEEPTPEEPTPEEPTPEEPTPETPVPELPTPEEPTPEEPTPDEPIGNGPTPPDTGIPDTGIDTMVSPSSLGIGATAGAVLGAAGLGASAMMNSLADKKDKSEENKEEESEENKIEEKTEN